MCESSLWVHSRVKVEPDVHNDLNFTVYMHSSLLVRVLMGCTPSKQFHKLLILYTIIYYYIFTSFHDGMLQLGNK